MVDDSMKVIWGLYYITLRIPFLWKVETLRKNLQNNFLRNLFSVKQCKNLSFLWKSWFYDTAL